MNSKTDRPKRRMHGFDLVLWVLTALAFVLAVAFVGQIILAILTDKLGPTRRVDTSKLPTIDVLRAEAYLVSLDIEYFPEPKSLPEAMALINPANMSRVHSGHHAGRVRVAVDYLSKQEIPVEARNLIAHYLLSAPLTPESLQLVKKVGSPANGPMLSKAIITNELMGPWMDLVQKWEIPLDEKLVKRLLGDHRLGPQFAVELINRDLATRPAVIEVLAGERVDKYASAYFHAVFSESDWLAIRIISEGESFQLTESMARQLAKDRPQTELMRQLVASCGNRVTEFSPESIPLLLALNDESLFANAMQKLRKIRPRAIDSRREENRQQFACRLIFELEKAIANESATKSPLIGVMAAMIEAGPNDVPWPMVDFLTRNPDVAEQAGVDETTSLYSKVTPSKNALDLLVATLRDSNHREVTSAARQMATIEPTDDQRAAVLSGLAPHLGPSQPSSNAARIAYCHWATADQDAVLARLATDKDPFVSVALVRALGRIQSTHLRTLANIHGDRREWKQELREAWFETGEQGEISICQTITRMGLKHCNPELIKVLGKIGGPRSLSLLRAMKKQEAGDPFQNGWVAMDEAIRLIEKRVSQAGEGNGGS